MRIHSVKLENFKSWSHAVIPFTEGVNAIVGRNGAGKSSILDAIGLALFDYPTGRERSGMSRQGTAAGTVTVTIESDFDGRPYEVVRRIGGDWQIRDIELGAKLFAGIPDVQAFLREHMGLSPTADLAQIFSDAVGVPQGKLTAVFLETHAKRKPVFDPLLEVAEYEVGWGELRETQSLLRERVSEVDVALSRLKGVLEQLPVVRQKLSAVQVEIEKDKTSLAQIETQLQAATRERVLWETRRVETQKCEQDEVRSHARLEASAAKAERASADLAEARRAQEIVTASKAGHEQHLHARTRRTALDADRARRQQLELERAAAIAALERAEQDRERARLELETIAADEAQAQALLPLVAQEEALRETLMQASADARHYRTTHETLERLKATLAVEQKKLEAMRAAAAKGAEIEAARTKAAAQLDGARQELEHLVEQIGVVTARGTAAKEQAEALERADGALCPVCEQPLTPDHVSHLQEQKQLERTQLRNEYSALAERRKHLDAQSRQWSGEEQRFAKQIAELPTPSALASAEDWCTELHIQFDEAHETVERLAAAPTRIQTLEVEIAALNAPQRARDVALKSVARRPAVVRIMEEASAAQSTRRAQLLPIDEALAGFAMLDADIVAVQEQEESTRQAYQNFLTNQQRATEEPARAEALAQAQEALADAQKAHDAARAALQAARSQYDAEKDARARDEEMRLEREAGALRRSVEMQEREARSLVREKERLLKQEVEHQQAMAQREALRHQQDVLEMMRSTIRQAGPQITRALIAQISAYAAQWFGELTGDFTRRLSWDEQYGINLEHDGRILDFKALSGGEQMAAALSVRLGLLRELSTIDIAFFDEPTAHLDVERREALAKQIMSVKGFRQIFVISHDDTFEHQTDNVIHIERVDGVSRVVTA